jgi:hypothetical protein
MPKHDKLLGIPKPADVKRIDSIDNTKRSHHKKKFPPHWEIRSYGWIYPSKRLKGTTEWEFEKVKWGNICCYKHSKEYEKIKTFFEAGQLDDALAIYAKHHPETANWPVRFINLQPMKTSREIIYG